MAAALRSSLTLLALTIAVSACAGKTNYIPEALSPSQLDQIVTQQGTAAGVQPALILAIIQVESGGNPRAVSRSGAAGLMQLTAATARRYGVADPFDPVSNVMGGVRFLRDLLAHYRQNLRLALAAWNLGQGAVDFAGGVPPKAEPFIAKVMEAYAKIEEMGFGR
jgi:soluble lytic murein transglycosylase-like protein